MKFRKKPVVIEAFQMHQSILRDVERWPDWLRESFHETTAQVGWTTIAEDDRGGKLAIRTLEGTVIADDGDWIIKGVKGEFYPCKPDIFAMTYEPVDAVAAAVGEGTR